MKISYKWLLAFIQCDKSSKEIAEILTMTGLEVESIEILEKIPKKLSGIVVGEVLACESHPNADKLKVTSVDIGKENNLTIVCGAPNVAQGQKVLVATVDTTLYPTDGKPLKIKKAKIRGVPSEGMICAQDEIGIGTNHDGIMVLNPSVTTGTPANQLFETEEDQILDIGLTPNRGDATSHYGVARDLGAYLRKKPQLPTFDNFEIKIERPLSVRVENKMACPRYSGILIRDVQIKESPDWLKQRLKSIGKTPINNLVDITNYVLYAIGQPLHAFDAVQIQGQEIVVKTLPHHTKFITLDNKEYTLSKDDLMICDGKENGLCLAGIFGGKTSGVTDNTNHVFIESAYFSPDYIRSSSQRHGLSTEASFRYERGTDPEITIFALKWATSLILKLAGGSVASELIDIYPEKIKPKKIDIDFQQFHKLIGEKIPNKIILEILDYLDIRTEQVTQTRWIATVPGYRSDVQRPVDLVEEVLRIYGFKQIPFASNTIFYPLKLKLKDKQKMKEQVSSFLVGKGYSEVLTNSLMRSADYHQVPLGKDPVSVLHPSSNDQDILKTSPIYTLLPVLAHNINHKHKNLKFFEFGKYYHKNKGEYEETPCLNLICTGDTADPHWLNASRATSFHDISQIAVSFFEFMGLKDYETQPISLDASIDYGLSYHKNNTILGKSWKIKDTFLDHFNLNQNVYFVSLNWEKLLNYYKTEVYFQPIPKYPEVKRDLSLIVEQSITYASIQKLTQKCKGSHLLKRMNLFSIYQGGEIGSNKKAYAISYFLQAKDKTLRDKQIDWCMDNLMRTYENEMGAIIRK